MNKIRILLADDHQIVREGFRALLEAQPDFEIVAETGDGLEAVRLAEHQKPHVLVVDLMMPGLNGLEVARQISQRLPRTHVVVLSMHANEAYVLEALKNGACGYVLKDASAAELVRADYGRLRKRQPHDGLPRHRGGADTPRREPHPGS